MILTALGTVTASEMTPIRTVKPSVSRFRTLQALEGSPSSEIAVKALCSRF